MRLGYYPPARTGVVGRRACHATWTLFLSSACMIVGASFASVPCQIEELVWGQDAHGNLADFQREFVDRGRPVMIRQWHAGTPGEWERQRVGWGGEQGDLLLKTLLSEDEGAKFSATPLQGQIDTTAGAPLSTFLPTFWSHQCDRSDFTSGGPQVTQVKGGKDRDISNPDPTLVIGSNNESGTAPHSHAETWNLLLTGPEKIWHLSKLLPNGTHQELR